MGRLAGEETARITDVVCGGSIKLHDGVILHRLNWQERTVFLCSSACASRFRTDPVQYLATSDSHRRIDAPGVN